MVIYTSDEIKSRLSTALYMFESEIIDMRRRIDDNNYLGVSMGISTWKERINLLQFVADMWEERARFERDTDKVAAEEEEESPF